MYAKWRPAVQYLDLIRRQKKAAKNYVRIDVIICCLFNYAMSTSRRSQDDNREGGGGACLARCGDSWLLSEWEDSCRKEWLIFLPVYTDWTLEEEIIDRIAKGNKAFCANKTLFKSNLVSGKSKLKLYYSVIRPIVVYGCEKWVLKESIIQKLCVWEENITENIWTN